jgi:hypothetical protein
MANEVNNNFMVFGNEKIQANVNRWKVELETIIRNEDVNVTRAAILKVICGIDRDDRDFDLDTKWIVYEGELLFISAWSPLNKLQDEILLNLSKIDKSVVVLNSYHNEDGSIGFRYVFLNAEGIIDDSASYEVSHEDYDMSDDEELEDALTDCAECEFQYVSDIVKNNAALKPYLKDHIKNLKKSMSRG